MENMRLWRVKMEAWKYEGGRVLISISIFSHLWGISLFSLFSMISLISSFSLSFHGSLHLKLFFVWP